jgi:CDP-diglyceride synthetase
VGEVRAALQPEMQVSNEKVCMFEITEYYRLIVPLYAFLMGVTSAYIIKNPLKAMWSALLLGSVACTFESWLMPDRPPWVIMFQLCLVIAVTIFSYFAKRIRRFAIAPSAEPS